MRCRTLDDCLRIDPEVWAAHVAAFRAHAREQLRLALNADDEDGTEHWRLHAFIVELDPRDWDGYGLLDRWDGQYAGESGDCSSGCLYYRALGGRLGQDWGVCTNPSSHRAGKLTFEHQGCPAFELGSEA
jgi:hypothetical protein